jgi:hypothetical protein
MKTVILAVTLCVAPVSAYAQFNDLMKTLQTITPPAATKSKEPAATPEAKSKPAPVKPAEAPATPSRDNPAIQSATMDQASHVDERICTRDSIAFSCKIKGKPLVYCKTFETEDPYMSVTLNHDYDSGKNELSFMSGQAPFLLSQEEGYRRSVTTVYFTQKNMTYGISECNGMHCNPEERYWFTTFKGTEKASQTFCDAETETEFAFPVAFDKKGKLVAQMKRVLAIKPSKLKFEPN